jgi:rod shape-determining protein MreC
MQVAIERRPTLLLIVVLGVLFLIMSASRQTRRVVGDTRTMFERMVMVVFSPVPKAVNAVGRNALDVYHGYVDMRRAVNENVRLRRQVSELTQENLLLRGSHQDLARMRALVAYSEQFSMPTQHAQVVMLDTSGIFKSVILDRGSDDGVEVNDTVVSPAGVVGRVVLTTRDLAKVQLVIDPSASVGSLIDRTRRMGVIRGDGRGGLRFEYIPSLSDVRQGDVVTTAGIDGIYPKGIPVCRVAAVAEGTDLFKKVSCAPTVDFQRLEEVLIIHTRKIPPEVVRYRP